MANKKIDACEDDVEYAPRPLHTYLFLGIVVTVVIVGAYLNRDAITALVTDVADAIMPRTIFVKEPAAPILPEPSCADECGRACWLTMSGAAEGTYADAHGAIGTLGCDGNCWSIADSARCCRNSDCATGMQCKDGVCSSE